MIRGIADRVRAREQHNGMFRTQVHRRLDTLEAGVRSSNAIGLGTEKRTWLILSILTLPALA